MVFAAKLGFTFLILVASGSAQALVLKCTAQQGERTFPLVDHGQLVLMD